MLDAAGPSNRYPAALNITAHFQKVLDLIREVSPATLVTGYREFGTVPHCPKRLNPLFPLDLVVSVPRFRQPSRLSGPTILDFHLESRFFGTQLFLFSF